MILLLREAELGLWGGLGGQVALSCPWGEVTAVGMALSQHHWLGDLHCMAASERGKKRAGVG